jgi:Na+-transporting methylmalonyl-CoA/oxaloacetate decarboxylase gamma subunit
MQDISQGVTVLIAGMAVLFVFMIVMILIVHYFQIIAVKLGKKR